MAYDIVKADKVREIRLGYEQENQTTKVVFDVSKTVELFGEGGTFTLAVTNPSYTEGYPAPVTYNSTDKTVEWVVTSAQLVKGYGSCQWTYTMNGSAVEKSAKYTVKVNDSIGSSQTPPTSYTSWLAVAEGYKNSAEASAEEAEDSKEAIENMTVSSHIETTTPSVTKTEVGGVVNLDFGLVNGQDGGTLFATFHIDENGNLIETTPEGFSGIVFAINNNCLEVQINGNN